jgi:hypothetical protein
VTSLVNFTHTHQLAAYRLCTAKLLVTSNMRRIRAVEHMDASVSEHLNPLAHAVRIPQVENAVIGND